MESSSLKVNLLDKDQFREVVVRSAGKGHDDISYQREDFANNNAEWWKCAYLCSWEFCWSSTKFHANRWSCCQLFLPHTLLCEGRRVTKSWPDANVISIFTHFLCSKGLGFKLSKTSSANNLECPEVQLFVLVGFLILHKLHIILWSCQLFLPDVCIKGRSQRSHGWHINLACHVGFYNFLFALKERSW